MRLFRVLLALGALACTGLALGAQAVRDSGQGDAGGPPVPPPELRAPGLPAAGEAETAIPPGRITIYSSGVSFFEHWRDLTGPAVLRLPFKATAMNDALKSLWLQDPASAAPLVSYTSEQSLRETLRSLSVDLSGSPGMAKILESLRGEELEILAPGPLRGRIMAVEYRKAEDGGPGEPWLSLLGPQGIKFISLGEIGSLRFSNPRLNADLDRALDLIMDSRNVQTRELLITLPGSGKRRVSLSYVIPSPVWKVSYRLDLGEGEAEARFQGWAIVDNDSDEDWRDVELSLAAGRPVSFIQNLYPPYYLGRPTLPLAIAGSAAPLTWDSSLANKSLERAYAPQADYVRDEMSAEISAEMSVMPRQAAPARAAGAGAPSPPPVTGADMADQFSFTLHGPVSLDRRTSAMFPLTDGEIAVRKFLIFSGARTGQALHPSVGVELTNTTGLRLPAGPVTVYDGGSYAGDALLEFLNRGERRLISWGEDLAVTGLASASSGRTVTAVTLSGGVMTISRRQGYERRYRLNNAGPEAKTVVIEHPITQGAVLAEPESSDETTAAAYRFIRELPPAGAEGTGEAEFVVREEIPLSEQISLVGLRPEALVSYASSQDIPANVRASLARAVELRQRAGDAERLRAETAARKDARAAEQDRIRRNLEAAGNGTQQGQEYLRRLTGLDDEIDRLNGDLDRQDAAAREAQAAYESYLRALSF